MDRRTRGSGALYQRASDRRWIGVAEVSYDHTTGKRVRRTVSAGMFCHALRKFSQLQPFDPALLVRNSRAENMARARTLGTHTAKEWITYGISKGWACEYCGRRTNHLNQTKDHRTPVARGGSDGIDNLAVACFGCNLEKNDMTETEFRWLLANQHGLLGALRVKPAPRRRRRISVQELAQSGNRGAERHENAGRGERILSPTPPTGGRK